eukprot:COSAG03_NODE_10513_length_646_cov_0.665448_3_plen_46_part_01
MQPGERVARVDVPVGDGLEILLLYFGDRRRRPDRSCGVFVLVLAGR